MKIAALAAVAVIVIVVYLFAWGLCRAAVIGDRLLRADEERNL